MRKGKRILLQLFFSFSISAVSGSGKGFLISSYRNFIIDNKWFLKNVQKVKRWWRWRNGIHTTFQHLTLSQSRIRDRTRSDIASFPSFLIFSKLFSRQKFSTAEILQFPTRSLKCTCTVITRSGRQNFSNFEIALLTEVCSLQNIFEYYGNCLSKLVTSGCI